MPICAVASCVSPRRWVQMLRSVWCDAHGGRVWARAASPSRPRPRPCRGRWAGPSGPPSSGQGGRVPTLVCRLAGAGVGRAALRLRCCCWRGRLASGWVGGHATWAGPGSSRGDISPVLAGPLEGEERKRLRCQQSNPAPFPTLPRGMQAGGGRRGPSGARRRGEGRRAYLTSLFLCATARAAWKTQTL